MQEGQGRTLQGGATQADTEAMQKSMPCEELVGEASGRGGGNAKDLGGHQRIRNGFCMLKEQQKSLHDWNRVSE